MFDVFLFKVPYTLVQYIGLAFVFSIYIFQGLKYLFFDMPRQRVRVAAKLAEVDRVDKANSRIDEVNTQILT